MAYSPEPAEALPKEGLNGSPKAPQQKAAESRMLCLCTALPPTQNVGTQNAQGGDASLD